ncbi:hypothetical protein HPP92_027712 [Vanilla planifolia]|uniref:Uncharacterized protein n=1 Tax=Vanilla planifolia TaxID=51239 RepID=A0A835U4Q1_VANPL|nr:hypothetical protein HPP92_027712 [Vanilla planifolia]
MGAEKNKFIEEVGSRGENLEYNFRWTRRNLAIVGLFGVAVPILIYKGIVNEFHMQDEDWGRPPRKVSLVYVPYIFVGGRSIVMKVVEEVIDVFLVAMFGGKVYQEGSDGFGEGVNGGRQ